MDSTDDKTAIPEFYLGPSDSFYLWQLRMRALLQRKGVLDVFTGDLAPPPETTGETEKKVYAQTTAKATAVLLLGLGERPLKAVQTDGDKPPTLWARLSTRDASKATSTKLMLLLELFTMRYSAGMQLAAHVANLELVFWKL